jgi:CHAT domain-containing protein
MLLMHLFYKILSAHRNTSLGTQISVAVAWHQAVRAFYRLNERSALALIDELESLWRATKGTRARPYGNYALLNYQLYKLRETITKGEMDFTSPCNWAPFALVGFGDVKIVGSGPDGTEEDGLVISAGKV